MFGVPPQLYSSNDTMVLSCCSNAGNIGRAMKEAGKITVFVVFRMKFSPKNDSTAQNPQSFIGSEMYSLNHLWGI